MGSEHTIRNIGAVVCSLPMNCFFPFHVKTLGQQQLNINKGSIYN